jgi:Holliday junction resolvasome RuvABC endonuclease subunit
MSNRSSCLALDPATSCGWAVTPEISGVWDLSIRRDESGGMKLLRLEAKLNEVAASVTAPLKLVVYEAARNALPKMQGSLVHQAKLQAIIERWCTEKGIDYKGYSPTEIKRFATGKGNANKEAMKSAAQLKFPSVKILDDNHADALLLLRLAERDFKFVLHP